MRQEAQTLKNSCLLGPILLPLLPVDTNFTGAITAAIEGRACNTPPPMCMIHHIVQFVVAMRKANTNITSHVPDWLLEDGRQLPRLPELATIAMRDFVAIAYRIECKSRYVECDIPDSDQYVPNMLVEDNGLLNIVVRSVMDSKLTYRHIDELCTYALKCTERAIALHEHIKPKFEFSYQDNLTLF